MKKIMFNDKYGLTRAVLEGIKTQTRRIVPKSALEDWEIHDKYHNLPDSDGYRMDFEYFIARYGNFKIDEEVAVAQAYKDIPSISDTNFVDIDWVRAIKNKPFGKWGCANKLPGWANKMFARADLMPHRIKITNIRVERLQDISEEDCLKEGFEKINVNEGFGNMSSHWEYLLTYDDKLGRSLQLGGRYHKEAYAFLIEKICGYGTWDSNPWVFVYDFELTK